MLPELDALLEFRDGFVLVVNFRFQTSFGAILILFNVPRHQSQHNFETKLHLHAPPTAFCYYQPVLINRQARFECYVFLPFELRSDKLQFPTFQAL